MNDTATSGPTLDTAIAQLRAQLTDRCASLVEIEIDVLGRVAASSRSGHATLTVPFVRQMPLSPAIIDLVGLDLVDTDLVCTDLVCTDHENSERGAQRSMADLVSC